MCFRSRFSNALTAWMFFTFCVSAVVIPNHVWAASTEISGLLEAELEFIDDFNGTSSSNIVLATAEIALDSELSEWFTAHVSLLYEQDVTDLQIDNGYIEYGNPFLSSIFSRVGQLYVPFGAFETNMVSDPLTLVLAETREVAFTLGYESGLHVTLFMFNGELQEAGSDDSIDNIGVDLGYIYDSESMNIDIGFAYMNNLGESDFLNEIIVRNTGDTITAEYVPGMIAHLIFRWGSIQFIGELAAATKDFAIGEIYASQKSKPSASNLELGYHFSDNWVIALGMQNSVDLSGYLPESRLLFATSYQIDEGTRIAFEYGSDSDYSTSKPNGTGNSGSSMVLQLAAEF
ncbi:LbtU family siderophore porin [Kaarinaea lacus]